MIDFSHTLDAEHPVVLVSARPELIEKAETTFADAKIPVMALPKMELLDKAINTTTPEAIVLDTLSDTRCIEACRQLKNHPKYQHIPVLLIVDGSDGLAKIGAFEAGASDILGYPFASQELTARVKHLATLFHFGLAAPEQQQGQIQKLQNLFRQKLKEAEISSILVLTRILNDKEDNSGKHIDRIRGYCYILAARLQTHPQYSAIVNQNFVDTISVASMLHDIGKLAISDTILFKPGKLTPEEFDLMKAHTAIGAKTIIDALQVQPGNPYLRMAGEIALSHHERWDGNGYPNRLQGTSIPLAAQIMAIADVHDALRAEKPYKKAMSLDETARAILRGQGTQFSEPLVACYLDVISQFEDWAKEIESEGQQPGA